MHAVRKHVVGIDLNCIRIGLPRGVVLPQRTQDVGFMKMRELVARRRVDHAREIVERGLVAVRLELHPPRVNQAGT